MCEFKVTYVSGHYIKKLNLIKLSLKIFIPKCF